MGTVLSAAAGAGLGHLVAGFVSPEASPVLAVGSTVIDLTPTPVKEWAVAQFGTADKPILVGSVAIGTLLIAGGIGLVARTHRSVGLALLGALAMTSVLAALLRPTSSSVDLLPGMVTAVAGVLLANWYLGLLDRLGETDRDPLAGADPDGTAREDGRSGRRSVLFAAAGLGAMAAAGGALGQVLGRGSVPDAVTLPAASEALAPLPAWPRVDGARHLELPHPELAVLPGRHLAGDPPCVGRRVEAHHRRRRRPPVLAHLRRAAHRCP